MSFNVSMDLTAGTPGGDNVYTACGVVGNGPGSLPGQGLYNKAEVDRTGDGTTDITDDACGDLPYVTMVKNFVGVTTNANGTYTVNYSIVVNNVGGATGSYSLKDTPLFDNDVEINSGTYSGQASGSMNTAGSTTLATNASISAGATHTYNVSFIVSMDLTPGTPGGDNVYTPCGVVGNGPGSLPGQGLYNKAEVDRTGDGITDITDDACGDLPYVTMVKDFGGATQNADGTYTVNYTILVNNVGGATGTYSLKDTPLFDNDVVINSGSYSGQASGPMNTSGSTTLATNASIGAGTTHTYNVSFNVSMDLTPGSPGGDNVYTPCGVVGNGPGSLPGQGLYNKAEVDRTGDGITDITDDACGDLPYVTMVKNFAGVTQNANGTYTVNYSIVVNNVGGATGSYSLKDTPLFDNDVVINSGSYSGQASGPMNTSGSTTLATSASIAAGTTHTYNVSFNVSMDLTAGSPGGDNVYTPCGVVGNGPGSLPGQGLYNKAEVDRTGDGITDITDDACGDLPYVTMVKNFSGVNPNANGTYTVNYSIVVNNVGGATGSYSLKDTPLFDNDVEINSGTYSGQASGSMNTTGSTTLATNASISAGATHTYNVSFIVSMDLTAGSPGGDNVYTACGVVGNGPGSQPGQGLYNKAEVDRTGDGITDITDDACGDLPYIKMRKDIVNVTPSIDGSFSVSYNVIVENVGGASGTYKLLDSPLFEDDVTIIDWSYNFQDVLASVGYGLAYPTAPVVPIDLSALGSNVITAGNTHNYTLYFRVSLDLEPGSTDGGDNAYDACEVSGNGPGSTPEHGLYNLAKLDRNNDGSTEVEDDACGDLPYVTMVKNFWGATQNADGTYTVNYTILVNNVGGATGTYSLKDTPIFDNDVVINSGSYSGQASGPMNTSGSTTLATNASIGAGTTHTYNVSFNVTMDLTPGSPGGDNVYTPCGVIGNGPGSLPGQGLYNKAELDKTGDGVTDITDDACGDIPYVTMVKNFVGVTTNANGTYTVNYSIVVNNIGGATGNYSLKDTPIFDNDVVINSGSYRAGGS
ncbi:MAG: hypothetical protein IPN29_16700 [Saprospiraceae bacterium]|nr:hypothetical protein [Saprospiraceae bacterium]